MALETNRTPQLADMLGGKVTT